MGGGGEVTLQGGRRHGMGKYEVRGWPKTREREGQWLKAKNRMVEGELCGEWTSKWNKRIYLSVPKPKVK